MTTGGVPAYASYKDTYPLPTVLWKVSEPCTMYNVHVQSYTDGPCVHGNVTHAFMNIC